MDTKAKLIQIQTSTDSRELADKLANGLLSSKLCACVKVTPKVASSYWWDGKIQKSEEYLIDITTLTSKYPAIEAYILANHTYKLPEIVATSIVSASADYIAWVNDIVW